MRASQRISLALSAILLSLVWPTGEHFSAHPNAWVAAVLAGIGALLFMVGWESAGKESARLSRLNLCAAIAVGFVLMLGAKDGVRAILGASCLSLLLLLWRGLVRRRLAGSVAMPALILILCGASSLVLRRFAWGLHDIPLTLPVGFLRRALTDIGLVGEGFSLWTGTRLETARITFEALGGYNLWFLSVVLGTMACLSRGTTGLRAAALGATRLVATLGTYAILRFAALVILAAELGDGSLIWRQSYTIISWLPLALILKVPPPPYASPFLEDQASTAGGQKPGARCCSQALARSHVLRLGSPALVGIALAFALAFNDPGQIEPGRVLIDETRADWEWTRDRFDTTSFGIRAEYNYFCLRDYLGHFYSVGTEPTNLAAALDTTDVLIIKTPTDPYTDSEITAIVRFVEQGGGLLLIGDHTNLFGMSTYLNSIASRFGMRFRFDDTFDLETTALSTYEPPSLWFHPAVRDVRRFEFLTSCTIEGGPLIEPVMVGYGLGSEDVDYGHPNFFSNITFDLKDRFGIFLQAGAKKYGKGRVLLFTDSTCFSNFCMFSPGKAELVLGFIDYLNRRGVKYPHARFACLLLAGALVGASLACAHRASVSGLWFARVTLVFLAALCAGVFVVARLNAHAYGPVRERAPLPRVLFDTDHSGASFFNYLGAFPKPRWQQFEEFYMCAQRMGLYPRAGSPTDIARCRPLALVIVNPVRAFSRSDITRIANYVRGGGRLVLLDTAINSQSTANQVLNAFALRMDLVSTSTTLPALNLYGVGRYGAGLAPASSAPGDLGPGTVTREVGGGKVTVVLDSFRYSAGVVGPPLGRNVASPAALTVYREIFALYRTIKI